MQIQAYAAQAANEPLTAFTYTDEIGIFDAQIAITHCGLCHSDLHLVNGDWGWGKFPLVPGHEIIGTVTAVGSGADQTLVGKRVGVGWQRSSCLTCEWCMSGQEELCADVVNITGDHYGGFAQAIITDSRFVHPIPDELSSANAAPLLCAGITVYSPLVRYADARKRVGVIGIGGLGHLALQYANKMGCDVTAFSTRDSKKDEAMTLGAHHFVNATDSVAMRAHRRSQDIIICTAPTTINLTPYLRALRPNGVLCIVGAPDDKSEIFLGHLFDNQAIAGSSIGGRQMMRDMLAFSARHNIQSWTEVLPFDAVNTALERLGENDVRYRFVLEN